jgi:1-acyl-sn-glycerol-3-phosphate acyltransferase
VWARRAVSVPLYVGIACALVVGAPAWLLFAGLADATLGPRWLWPRTRAMAFFTLFFLSEALGVAVAALVWLRFGGGRLGGRERFLDANAALQRAWSTTLFRGGLWLFSARVELQDLGLARRGPLLLFVRHASAADTVLAAALVANPNRLLLRYVLKRELLWDPCLDIVGRRLPNAFIDRAAARNQGEIDAIAGLADGLGPDSAVLIYPEGTRFAPQKLTRAIAKISLTSNAQTADIASQYRNVLPPRPGGALALLDAAPETDVVFLEHTGFEGAATLASFWRGGLVGATVRVRLRRFSRAAIPRDNRAVWLYERWAEMDGWIGAARDGEPQVAAERA